MNLDEYQSPHTETVVAAIEAEFEEYKRRFKEHHGYEPSWHWFLMSGYLPTS